MSGNFPELPLVGHRAAGSAKPSGEVPGDGARVDRCSGCSCLTSIGGSQGCLVSAWVPVAGTVKFRLSMWICRAWPGGAKQAS